MLFVFLVSEDTRVFLGAQMKEVTLPCDEEVTEDSVTVVLGLNNNVAKNAKKKEKKSKAPTKN